MVYDSPFHSIIIFESLSCDGGGDKEASLAYSVRVYVSLVIIYVFKKSSSDITIWRTITILCTLRHQSLITMFKR